MESVAPEEVTIENAETQVMSVAEEVVLAKEEEAPAYVVPDMPLSVSIPSAPEPIQELVQESARLIETPTEQVNPTPKATPARKKNSPAPAPIIGEAEQIEFLLVG